MSQRRYVVTGSASGIGAATRRVLEAEGHAVVGVDLREAEIAADLSLETGRAALERVERVDAVIACAGVSGATAPSELVVRLNYFGAVATLERLRPRLAEGTLPRAAAVASTAALFPADEALVDACLAGDEERAAALARPLEGPRAYISAKRALARWVRRQAPAPEWAGAGIPLNAVGPGVILTAMTQERVSDPELREQMRGPMPMPLKWPGDPEDVASLLVYLTSPANTLVTGQHIFVDGGFDAVTRGDDVY
jgi:NAD(P)-dependent dehydrogenase (short-subunit alcohol dehydrogenase family)